MVERVIRGLIALTVTAAVARHLGRDDYGLLSYALSFVLLFSTFWTLGLTGIVVRDLVQRPTATPQILGTVFGLRIVGGCLGLGVILVAALGVGVRDQLTLPAIAIIAGSTLFFAFDGIDFWLQSRLEGGWTVFARSAGVAASAVMSIAMILVDAPLIWFAAAIGIEYVITGLALLFSYWRLGQSIRTWRFDLHLVRRFLATSWPLIISGALYSVNMKVDQLMLGGMQGAGAVGIYAAAARLSEVWYFVPTALAASVFPSLLRVRDRDPERYSQRTQQLFDLLVGLSVPLAIATTIFSPVIISVIYGPQFAASAPVLALHIWAGPFVFLGQGLSKWLIAEDELVFSMVRHGLGALTNVVLNVALIPTLGPIGAALATLVSYGVAGVLATWAYRPTRKAGRQMALALVLPVRLVVSVLRSEPLHGRATRRVL